MLTLMCAMGGVFVMAAMMPSYLTDYLKLSVQDMGLVTSAIGFGGCARAVRHADASPTSSAASWRR